MQRSLIALAIGTFALGIAEFAMMGILTDVATELDISIVKAGHLISAYSAGVAVGAPGLLVFRRWSLKSLALLLAAIIATGNACAALSPNFTTLLLSRFISGLPHGAFFGAGAIMASRLAAPGKGAQAVATMVAGMTVANVVGVPCATLVTNLLSWRVAFAIVSFFGMLAFTGIRAWVPRLDALPDSGFKGQFRFLKSPQPWLVYAGVFFGQASVYTYLSYVNPIMTEVAGFSENSMTWIMMVLGTGMVVGNVAAGKLADRYPGALVTAWIAVLIIAVMPAIYLVSAHKLPLVALSFIATGCLFGLGGPLQFLIVRFAKGGELLGGAGIQIAFNVSNAMAATLGGTAIHLGLGLTSPALVGIPCAAIGAVALFYLHHRYHT